MKREDALRLFGLNNLSIEADLRRIAQVHDIEIGRKPNEPEKVEQTYYPQFPERLRDEAAKMAAHYAIFYCLENSIRELVAQRLEEAHGARWWDIAVPEVVRKNAEGNRKKELSTGITPRSDELIDYSNFGELGEIIKTNWNIFGDMFRDIRGLERVLGNLNTLRAPIAHCKSLAEDEVVRLHLSLRDWFRQME
ncbi:MAG: Swt1 family HEPN domain-containing protein [Hyphomicrobiaceae bacterium]